MAAAKKEQKAFETKVVANSKSQKVWCSFDLEDIKSMDLDPNKVTGSEVVKHVRAELDLPERKTRSGGGKGKYVKALKTLSADDLKEIAEEKGLDIEEE